MDPAGGPNPGEFPNSQVVPEVGLANQEVAHALAELLESRSPSALALAPAAPIRLASVHTQLVLG